MTAAAAAAPPPDRLEFTASAWLRGAHAQTIFASQFCPRPRVAYRRERWDTPDGDFIDVDFLAGPAPDPRTPCLIVFHGLEGSSRSHYARSLMDLARCHGWQAAVAHFRGCGGEPNRLPRAYHSGDSAEIDWILHRFTERLPAAPLHVVGVSLGGNALLKWLGEQGAAAASRISAAASLCAPLDLQAAGAALDHGFTRIYAWNFLSTLKRKALDTLTRFPGLFDGERLRRARTMREFDDVFTAPLHGFRDVDDYWTRASSKPVLGAIGVPTLLINALDDPFMPASVLPGPAEVSAQVQLEYPARGGHVGFVSGALPGDSGWPARRIAAFFAMPGS